MRRLDGQNIVGELSGPLIVGCLKRALTVGQELGDAASQNHHSLRAFLIADRKELARITREPPELTRIDGSHSPRHGPIKLLQIGSRGQGFWKPNLMRDLVRSLPGVYSVHSRLIDK